MMLINQLRSPAANSILRLRRARSRDETFSRNCRIAFRQENQMTRVSILGLALSAAIFGADSKDVNRTVALRANGLVEIETHKGSIRVSVWDRQEVAIQARIEAEPGTEMDRRRFDGTEVRIDSSAESVRIQTYYPDFNWCCSFDNGTNPEVRYTIKMPKAARLVIRDHRSDTEVTGLQGALDLTTHRGSAHIRGLGGALHLDTYRGDAQVEFSTFTGDSSVKTYRGSVELTMPKNSRFDLHTNSGRRGSIYTDFSVITHAVNRRGESAHGAVNGGGPALRLEAERGEVRVHAR
jgi:hypothetical protein